MNKYDEDYEDYEDYDGDIRDKVPVIVGTIRVENEDGDEEEIDIEIDPKLLEIVDSQIYDEKSDDSMGAEVEHTLEGEIDVNGDTYFVVVIVWEYPINSVNDYEVVRIEKM